MSSKEFSEWMAYYTIEPFGQWRDNYHATLSASILANVNRGKSQQPYSINDFMYKDKFTSDMEKQKQFISNLEALAHNGN